MAHSCSLDSPVGFSGQGVSSPIIPAIVVAVSVMDSLGSRSAVQRAEIRRGDILRWVHASNGLAHPKPTGSWDTRRSVLIFSSLCLHLGERERQRTCKKRGRILRRWDKFRLFRRKDLLYKSKRYFGPSALSTKIISGSKAHTESSHLSLLQPQ